MTSPRLAPVARFAAVVVVLVSVALTGTGPGPVDAALAEQVDVRASAPVCSASGLPDERFFALEPGGVRGADYQRATPLGDGVVLWTFQDAEVRRPDGSSTLVHNIGMLQRGSCFTVLMSGTPESPRPWLGAADTTEFRQWYWPLDAAVGDDGRVYVFLAEMFERSAGYLIRTEPASTLVAVVDAATGAVVGYDRPGNSSPSLYGWSIESDARWTYLYAQCHRQFGFDPYIYTYAHDFSCSSRVTLARVPRGQPLAAPVYWTGSGWSGDAAAAVPVVETAGRMVNATQVMRSGVSWMAITKVGDWWGDRIVVERADRPTGPYRVVAEWTASPRCAVDCNTYFASWVPSPDPAVLRYGLSHNRWDGVFSDGYRPTFGAVGAPSETFAIASRCSLGHCG